MDDGPEALISQDDLHLDAAHIMHAVESGTGCTVTRDGLPIARLVPFQRRIGVPREEVLVLFRDSAPVSREGFRAPIEEIDDASPGTCARG